MNSVSPRSSRRLPSKSKRSKDVFPRFFTKEEKNNLFRDFKVPENKWSSEIKYAVEKVIQHGQMNPADGWEPYTIFKTEKFKKIPMFQRQFPESRFHAYGARLYTEQPLEKVVGLMHRVNCDEDEIRAFHNAYPHGDAVLEIRAEKVDDKTFEYYGLTDFQGITKGLLWNRDVNTLVYMDQVAEGVYIEAHFPINTVQLDRTKNVRMTNYQGGYILRRSPSGGTCVDYYNLIDPKGFLPPFILGIGAQYIIEIAVDFVDYCDKTLSGKSIDEIKGKNRSRRKVERRQKVVMPQKEELAAIKRTLAEERRKASDAVEKNGLAGGNPTNPTDKSSSSSD